MIILLGGGQWGSNTGFELVISIAAIVVVGIWALTSNGDMGTHGDTGRPVKSLNTSPGKRNRQRRAYRKRKLQEIPVYYLDPKIPFNEENPIDNATEVDAFTFCEKRMHEKYKDYYFRDGDEKIILKYYEEYLDTF